MPRRVEEDEYDGESDWGDDEPETIPCPYCNQQIHEDSVRCPHCENYLSQEDAAPPSRKPWWIILGVIVCLYLVYRWIVG